MSDSSQSGPSADACSSVDLADPSVEPTDEQLAGLWARACDDARAIHAASLARLRDAIAAERRTVLDALEASVGPHE